MFLLLNHLHKNTVMGIKGRRVHMIEELSQTIISFQRGKQTICRWLNSIMFTHYKNNQLYIFFNIFIYPNISIISIHFIKY